MTMYCREASQMRYALLDTLCITQDCENELNDQIQQMGKVYAESSLTIFAVPGFSADRGLDFKRNDRARKPTKIHFRFELHGQVVPSAGFIFSFRCLWSCPRRGRSAEGASVPLGLGSSRASLIASVFAGFRYEIPWRCVCERSFEIDPGCSTIIDLDMSNFKDHG
ncbi:hypothetical protein V8F20_005292 [Naviculisporaceae sp. PSN 640]